MRNSMLRIVLAGIFLLGSHAAMAASSDEQMLPPQPPGVSGIACATGRDNVLVMHDDGTGGKSAINCNQNLTADISGNIKTNGYINLGSDGSTVGSSCSSPLAGAIQYDSVDRMFIGCSNASGSWVWGPLAGSTLPSCSAGQVITNIGGTPTCTSPAPPTLHAYLSSGTTCAAPDVVIFCGYWVPVYPGYSYGTGDSSPNSPPTVPEFSAIGFGANSCSIPPGASGYVVVCGGVNN